MPVNIVTQLESNWCWAAVAVAVNCLFSPESAMQQCGVAKPVLTTRCRSARQSIVARTRNYATYRRSFRTL
jgi:hypothetical protein